jgi:hypothetical protein
VIWKKLFELDELDSSIDSFSKAVTKNGLPWTIAFYGGFYLMEIIFILVPLSILVTAYFLSDIPVIGPLFLVCSRPWNLLFLSLVGGGGFAYWRSLGLHPEGIMVRESVLDKTSRSLPGGKFHFFHPFSRLKGYFSGEHIIDSEEEKHISNAKVMDAGNFYWYVDMAFVFKAQNITSMAGGPYERDIDMLWLGSKKRNKKEESNGLAMEDLSSFDLTKIERMQIVKRISVDIQNQVGIFFQTLSTEKVQSQETKKSLAKELNKVAQPYYSKDIDGNDLSIDNYPFIFTVKVNQILPASKTQEDLGSIAKVDLMLKKGLINSEDAAEILKREALRGAGGVIFSGDFGKKPEPQKKSRR